MARHTGKGLVVMCENASATEVALTHVTAAETPDQDFEEVEFRGDDVVSYGAGQRNGFVNVDMEYDDTATTGNWAVLSAILGDNTNPKFVRVRPVGTGSGLLQYSLDAVLTSCAMTGLSRDGKPMIRAVFKNHKEASADPAWAAQSP